MYNGSLLLYSVDAIKQGLLTEADVRDGVKPLFYTRMRLGEFDPPEDNPYTKLDLSVIQSKQHQQLALDAAMQSFVLLKNKNGFLPLDKQIYDKIAVSGHKCRTCDCISSILQS